MPNGTTSHPRIPFSGIQSPQSIYEVSTTQHHEIGEAGVLIGGRCFYYCRHTGGAAIARGRLAAAATPLATEEELACVTAALVPGATEITGITFGAASADANAFQYISTNQLVTDMGGIMFRIKSHPALTSGGVFAVQLWDPIPATITSIATTTLSLSKDTFADVIVAPAAETNVPAGVCNVDIPIGSTTPQYAWLQTQGPGPAYVSGTPAEGLPLVMDGAVAGGLIVDSVVAQRTVAWMRAVTNTTLEATHVDWCIRGV
jgi:hypothetical protein